MLFYMLTFVNNKYPATLLMTDDDVFLCLFPRVERAPSWFTHSRHMDLIWRI